MEKENHKPKKINVLVPHKEEFSWSEEYLINYCKRDNVWIVQRRTARKSYMYITIAECFTAESAEILREALIKKWKESK